MTLLVVCLGLTAVIVLDLAVAAWAQHALPGRPLDGWPLSLQLAYNPGVAFGLGSSAPAWLVLLVTGGISAALLLLGWGPARRSRGAAAGLGVAAGGALGNLLDRAGDGLVTDYLHTGWWPTFNLADVAIIAGALLLLAAEVFAAGQPADGGSCPASRGHRGRRPRLRSRLTAPENQQREPR